MGHFKVHGGPEFQSAAESAGLAAIGLWAVAGSWSARYETNGEIPEVVVRHLGGTRRLTKRLVASGLWEATDDGWRFKGWRKSQDGDYRKNIRASVRKAVMDRDGRRCTFCSSPNNLSLDHIVRYRDNGPDTIENLRVLCMPCNLERG